MVTAYPEVETVNRAFKEGAAGFLGKPFDVAVLRAVLREIAAKKCVGLSGKVGPEYVVGR
jgi:FixJ family two-component response regulator